MARLSDSELLEELKTRFLENKKYLIEQQKLTEQLKGLNKRLEESEALKSHFLSNIKNEINNPLASILALSTNLTRSNAPDEEQVKHTATLIHKEAFSLDFQLKNIFMAAELEAGDFTPNMMHVEPISIIDGLIASYSRFIDGKKQLVNLHDKLEGQNAVIIDSEKFQLIVSNILHNAIEFSDENKQIDISVYIKDSSSLVVSFKDEGIGIPEEQQHLIYDRFKQLDSGTTKAHLGHGLGLSVVKALLQILGGNIKLESKPNEGSTFIIEIPLGEESQDSGDYSTDGNEFLFDADESF